MTGFLLKMASILPMAFYIVIVMGANTAAHAWYIGVLMWAGFWILFDVARSGLNYVEKNY